MKQAHIFVKGKVTGVFYRAAVEEEAKKLGVKGWVRNVYSDQEVLDHKPGVEVVLQGDESAVDNMIVFLRTGSPYSEVDDIVITQEEALEEYTSFERRPSV